MREAQVALTDPAPGLVARGEAQDDLFQLGQLIHELVLHHPFAGAWPVAPTRAWSDLGRRSGRGWRKLCNRLLNPNPEKRPAKAGVGLSAMCWRCGRKSVAAAGDSMVLLLARSGVVVGMQLEADWRLDEGALAEASDRGDAAGESGAVGAAQAVGGVPQVSQSGRRRRRRATGADAGGEAGVFGEYQALYEQRGWNGPAQYLANLRARFGRQRERIRRRGKALADTRRC
jgi:hypothetical protein